MSPRRLLILALSSASLPHAAAHGAAVVTTPTLFPGTAVQALCIVTNIAAHDADVTLQIINAIGGGVQAQASGIIEAGRINFTSDSTPIPSYCQVTGLGASKVRVTFCMANSSQNCISTVTAP